MRSVSRRPSRRTGARPLRVSHAGPVEPLFGARDCAYLRRP